MIRLRVLVPCCLALLCPTSALAAQRFASPTGTTSQSCATALTACDINTALIGHAGNVPHTGDEVIIEPGTYSIGSTLAPSVAMYVHGVAGQPRPVITGPVPLLDPGEGSGATYSYLDFEYTGNSNNALSVSGNTLDRLLIRGRSSEPLCQCYDGALRNSLIVVTGSIGSAYGFVSNGGTGTETLRNDTFISTASGAAALLVQQMGSSPIGSMKVDARNVATLNTVGGHDVEASGKQVTLTIGNSRYANAGVTTPAVLTNAGGNTSADPGFAEVATQDFHLQPTSPLIDTGSDDATNDGSLDYDGNARMIGAHTDIGAFEYVPSAATVSVTGGSGQSAVVGQAYPSPLQVRVTDPAGRPVAGSVVTFTTPAGGATARFGFGAVQWPVTTAADGTATAPTLIAGTLPGGFTVSAAVSGLTASWSLHNLAGTLARLVLTPSVKSVLAGTGVTYTALGFDGFANPLGAPASSYSIRPDGSCRGAVCTPKLAGSHTVTATSGFVRSTAQLTASSSTPKFSLRARSLSASHRSKAGRLAIECAVRGLTRCSVSVRLTWSRRLRLPAVSARGTIVAGRSTSVRIRFGSALLSRLKRGSLPTSVSWRIVAGRLSTRGSGRVTLRLVR